MVESCSKHNLRIPTKCLFCHIKELEDLIEKLTRCDCGRPLGLGLCNVCDR
jgi:hypothetical protein